MASKPKRGVRGKKKPPKKAGSRQPSSRARKASGRGRGRPRKEVSVDEIEKMAAVGCTQEDIARVKSISVDTLHRNFAEAYENGRAQMRCSLRKKQFETAMGDADHAPNPTMQIWLGKNELGQTDKFEIDWRSEAIKRGLRPSDVFEEMVATAKAKLDAQGA